MARTSYKWFNINIIGPGKRVNGKSGKAKTTIFWPHYSGKCRTVGTYSPRRNQGGLRHQGRPRKQWIHDIEEWSGCEYIQLNEMSQDRAQWRRKILEFSSAVANLHRARLLVKIHIIVSYRTTSSFYCATRMHSAYMPWWDVCLSVRLCVCHTPVLCLNRYRYPQFFFTIG